MLEKVLNTSLQLYLFHVLVLKKREDKPYQYQSIQKFSANTLRLKHIPDFLQLLQKQTNLKIHSLTKFSLD